MFRSTGRPWRGGGLKASGSRVLSSAGSGVISCPEPREKDEGWLPRDRAANRVGCFYFLFLNSPYLFIFSCAGSSLLLRLFSSEQGYCLAVVCGPRIAVASLVAE